MDTFSKTELQLFKKLKTPAKVQDFLNTIPTNRERNGKDTIKSPLRVLRENNAHCIEGALLGAYILSLHDYVPRIVHLKASQADLDHVIAVFQEEGLWGALSKTNYGVLRYREPVYKNLRELVMSYFHEYFTNSDGKKSLRSYSAPLDLRIFEDSWPIEREDLWGIDEELDSIEHFNIAPKTVLKKLRPADPIEQELGKITEWKK